MVHPTPQHPKLTPDIAVHYQVQLINHFTTANKSLSNYITDRQGPTFAAAQPTAAQSKCCKTLPTPPKKCEPVPSISKMANKKCHDPADAKYNRTATKRSKAHKQHEKQHTGMESLSELTQNLGKKNTWTRGNWKDVKTGFLTKLKRVCQLSTVEPMVQFHYPCDFECPNAVKPSLSIGPALRPVRVMVLMCLSVCLHACPTPYIFFFYHD